MGYGSNSPFNKKTTIIQTKGILMMCKCANCGTVSIQNVPLSAAAVYADSYTSLRRAKMICACPRCLKKMPWYDSDYSWVEIVTILSFVVGVFGIGVLEGYHHPIQLIPFALSTLLVLGVVINESIKEIRTRILYKACPPVFGQNAEQLLQQAESIPGYLEQT